MSPSRIDTLRTAHQTVVEETLWSPEKDVEKIDIEIIKENMSPVAGNIVAIWPSIRQERKTYKHKIRSTPDKNNEKKELREGHESGESDKFAEA